MKQTWQKYESQMIQQFQMECNLLELPPPLINTSCLHSLPICVAKSYLRDTSSLLWENVKSCLGEIALWGAQLPSRETGPAPPQLLKFSYRNQWTAWSGCFFLWGNLKSGGQNCPLRATRLGGVGWGSVFLSTTLFLTAAFIFAIAFIGRQSVRPKTGSHNFLFFLLLWTAL